MSNGDHQLMPSNVFLFSYQKLVRWHIFRKFYYPPRVMTVDPRGSDRLTSERDDELLIGSARETWNDKILILKGHLGGDQAGEVMQRRWHEHVYINSCKTWLVSIVRAKVLSKLMETFKSVCKLIQSVWPEKLAHTLHKQNHHHVSQLGAVQTVVNVFEKSYSTAAFCIAATTHAMPAISNRPFISIQ